jgi:uncharacterized protein YjbI with pentapeptide repeats
MFRARLVRARLGAVQLRDAEGRVTGRSWRTNLGAANLAEADLSGADLRGANLLECELRGARLDGALIDRTRRPGPAKGAGS